MSEREPAGPRRFILAFSVSQFDAPTGAGEGAPDCPALQWSKGWLHGRFASYRDSPLVAGDEMMIYDGSNGRLVWHYVVEDVSSAFLAAKRFLKAFNEDVPTSIVSYRELQKAMARPGDASGTAVQPWILLDKLPAFPGPTRLAFVGSPLLLAFSETAGEPGIWSSVNNQLPTCETLLLTEGQLKKLQSGGEIPAGQIPYHRLESSLEGVEVIFLHRPEDLLPAVGELGVTGQSEYADHLSRCWATYLGLAGGRLAVPTTNPGTVADFLSGKVRSGYVKAWDPLPDPASVKPERILMATVVGPEPFPRTWGEDLPPSRPIPRPEPPRPPELPQPSAEAFLEVRWTDPVDLKLFVWEGRPGGRAVEPSSRDAREYSWEEGIEFRHGGHPECWTRVTLGEKKREEVAGFVVFYMSADGDHGPPPVFRWQMGNGGEMPGTGKERIHSIRPGSMSFDLPRVRPEPVDPRRGEPWVFLPWSESP